MSDPRAVAVNSFWRYPGHKQDNVEKSIFHGSSSCIGDTMVPDSGLARFIRKGKRLYTLSGENNEPRIWDPFHSKLAAFILKGGELDLDGITNVLYLGGGHGTTVSHLSDLLPVTHFYVVEFGPSMGDILVLSRNRENIYPIMEDARCPSNYAWIMNGIQIDMLYQDIAQKDQVGIMKQNIDFL